MSLNIDSEIKKAMLEKNQVKLTTVKAIKAAFTIAKTEKGSDGTLTPEQEIKIIQKLATQRKESYEIFSKENRPELAEREKQELDILSTFLPKQMTDEELQSIVTETISEVGATTIKDMGKVIGAVTKKVAGQAEGARISGMVKSILNK